jgi:3-hydroxyisobutyrate dehydrogenase-like beta-hydroxyacid dehydrogenase
MNTKSLQKTPKLEPGDGRRIAFLGLGAMGSRMAMRLLAAGYQVAVWNRTPGRALLIPGARSAATPAATAEGADVVISMLRDDAASQPVWLDSRGGALSGLSAGAIAVECSTVTSGWARELHHACAASGVRCLDAPVAGSRPQAEAGQLIFMAGGDAAVLNQVEPVLLSMGQAVFHAGPVSAGAVTKLLVNTLLAVQVAALAELLAMARGSGIDTARAIEIVGSTPVASPAAKAAAASMLAGSFAPLFPIDLAAKDLGYALDAAGTAERAPVTAAVEAVLARAIEAGCGDQHLTAVARLYS